MELTLDELRVYDDPFEGFLTLFCGERETAQSVVRVFQVAARGSDVRYVFVYLPSPCAGEIDVILAMAEDGLLLGWINEEFCFA